MQDELNNMNLIFRKKVKINKFIFPYYLSKKNICLYQFEESDFFDLKKTKLSGRGILKKKITDILSKNKQIEFSSFKKIKQNFILNKKNTLFKFVKNDENLEDIGHLNNKKPLFNFNDNEKKTKTKTVPKKIKNNLLFSEKFNTDHHNLIKRFELINSYFIENESKLDMHYYCERESILRNENLYDKITE